MVFLLAYTTRCPNSAFTAERAIFDWNGRPTSRLSVRYTRSSQGSRGDRSDRWKTSFLVEDLDHCVAPVVATDFHRYPAISLEQSPPPHSFLSARIQSVPSSRLAEPDATPTAIVRRIDCRTFSTFSERDETSRATFVLGAFVTF